MKKLILTFLYATIVNISIGQDHKLQFGVNFSPEVTSRVISGTKNAIHSMEIPKISYTTGLNFVYNLNKTIGFETGLQYINKGYQTEKIYLLPDNWWIGVTSNNDEVRFIYNYQYLTIPLKTNFILGNKNVKFIGSLGIDTWFLVNASRKQILYHNNAKESVKTTKIDGVDFNKINISPIISTGID